MPIPIFACRVAYPNMTTLLRESFETAMDAVRDGRADLAMLPRENTPAGRVPGHSPPAAGFPACSSSASTSTYVEHCLLAIKGATVADLEARPFAHGGAGPGTA